MTPRIAFACSVSLVLLLSAAGLAPPGAAAAGGLAPSARHDAGLAWSHEMGALILYGGVAGTTLMTDTWKWNGHWGKVNSVAVPEMRPGFALAEHPWKETVMLAGLNPAGAFETWELVSGQWHLRFTSVAPTDPPLFDKAQTYYRVSFDAETAQVLLVLTEAGKGVEVWKWDDAADVWEDPFLSPFPTVPIGGRTGYVLSGICCPKNLLFGGIDPGTGMRFAQTAFRLFGTGVWKPVLPHHEPPATSWAAVGRTGFGFCGNFVMFGGETDAGLSADTWCWDGDVDDWKQPVTAHSPAARSHHAMGNSNGHTRAYLFGGIGADGHDLGDLWYAGIVCPKSGSTCSWDWVQP